MKKGFRSIILILICSILLVLSGCWDQKLYEEIGLILQLGIEIDQEGKLLFSKTSPVISPEAKEEFEMLTVSSETMVKAAKEKMRNVSGKQLQAGKTQHIYFSKELAQRGIYPFLDSFLRNAENPVLSNIVVVNGSPKEMLELSKDYNDKPRPAIYMNDLLGDARERGNAFESRVHNFTVLFYSQTIDPAVPMVTYDQDNIEVIGSALFSGDRMVGEIDANQTLLLSMLMEEHVLGGDYFYEDELAEDKGVGKASILIKRSRVRMKASINNDIPTFDILLDIKANLDEYTGERKLDEPEYLRRLEQDIEVTLAKECKELLKQLQEMGSDPIGFGEILRSRHNRYWKTIHWQEKYKEAAFDVKVKVKIDFYGVYH